MNSPTIFHNPAWVIQMLPPVKRICIHILHTAIDTVLEIRYTEQNTVDVRCTCDN
jgi:hypothetical protein